VIPDNLRKAKVGNLDHTDATRAHTLDELAFVLLVFVSRRLRLRVLGGNEWCGVEEQVLGFDIARKCQLC
jgi:hypothetical protein